MDGTKAEVFVGIEETAPDGMEPLVRSRMVICFAVPEPEIEMWVDGRDAQVQTTFSRVGYPDLAEEMLGTE